MLVAVVAGVFLAGLGIGYGVSVAPSPSFDKQIEEQNARIASLEDGLKSTNEKMSALELESKTMNEKISDMQETMDMIMNMASMGDMMGQEPLDVIIKMKSNTQKVEIGKEAKIVLLVLDKETEEPMPGVEVVIGIERGWSMSTMDMMGDMFGAEDIGSGEYAVRFTPNSEGVYTIHTMVMLAGRSMMDNHQDFGIIAE
jgi:hypothetical protein